MTRRTDRVNANLRQQLSEVLASDVKDPRIDGMVSIVDVETTGDLRRAKVFISVYGSQDARKVVKALNSASGFVGRQLSNRLAMRTVPHILFKLDTSIEHGADMSAKILRVTRVLPPLDPDPIELDPNKPSPNESSGAE
jgi:ribosome-binding factor A